MSADGRRKVRRQGYKTSHLVPITKTLTKGVQLSFCQVINKFKRKYIECQGY